jgi:carbonic anhydrase/acetyltransferase-like protein (isoleucine patch superfamily)
MNKARFTAPNAVILGDPDIGEGSWIGYFSIIESVNAKVTIGKNCSIASGVHIYTHSTHELVTEGKEKLVGSVKIGDNVAIGANSVIMYDVSIGDNVCIPALTVVKPHTRIERNNV